MFWDRPLFYRIYKRTILIPQCSGFFLKNSLHVSVAMSVSIRTNFKPDLISLISNTIVTFIPLFGQRWQHFDLVFGHKSTFGQNIFAMNPVQVFARVTVARHVFQI